MYRFCDPQIGIGICLSMLSSSPWGMLVFKLFGQLLLAAIALSLAVAPLVYCATLPTDAKQNPQRWLPLADNVFQHWLTEQGLPHSAVTALAQDASGFLWIGTQSGLARWDGYQFRSFKFDAVDANSLPDNFVRALFVDHHGKLWIGTNGAGLASFDVEQERFIRYPVGAAGVSHQTIYSIVGDGAQGLWIGTRIGLDHVPLALAPQGVGSAVGPGIGISSGSGILHWKQNPDDKLAMPSDTVRALLRAQDGKLWLGTPRGMFYLDVNRNRFVPLVLPVEVNEAPNVDALLQARDGMIWIATRGQGMYRFDPKTGQVIVLHENTAGVRAAGFGDSLVSVAEAANGEIWFGTYGDGMIVVDSVSLQTRRIRHDASVPTSLLNDRVWAILRDRAGLLWVGTQRGLTRHDPNHPAILSLFGSAIRSDGLPDSGVTAILPMPDGKVWLGAGSRGVTMVDPQSPEPRQLRWLHADGRFPETSLPQMQIHEFAILPNQDVLISTENGVYRADAIGSRVQKLHLQMGDAADRASVLHVYAGQLWLAGQDGVWQVDLKELSANQPSHKIVMRRPPGLEPMARHAVTVMEHDKAGVLWIGTHTHGLFRYEVASHQLRHMVPEPNNAHALRVGNVAGIAIDSRGWVWVGTQGGGLHLLKQTRQQPAQFERFGQEQGLSNDMVNKVLEDAQGRIWLSTDDGLAVIDPQSLALRMLQRAQGVAITTYWSNAGARGAQGELLFGGNLGLTVVRPEYFSPLSYQANLVFSNLQVGGKSVPAGRFNLSAAEQAQRPEAVLQIPSDANSLAVEFAMLDFARPEQQRYGYRLEGFNNDWVDNDANRRLAAYTNLPPGEYRLRLRTSLGDGVWREHERALALRVLPAWYQTIWFYLAVLVALTAMVAALIHVLIHARTRYMRQRQRELEQQVQQRTQELQQKQGQLQEANTGLAQSVADLHQAQAQLVQQEKLASLGGLVAGVAHEINTPLGTTLVAITGVADIWRGLQERLTGGSLSRSSLEQAAIEGKEYTELALRSAARAAELIDSFKAVAVEYESDQTQTFDLLDYLSDIAMLVRSPIDLGGHQLELQVEPGLMVQIVPEALTEALTRILANVLDHAFSADSPGRVRLAAQLDQAGLLCIEVSDDGCGIAPEHLPKVFDPFFSTKSGMGQHIGLGLYVAYNHVAQRLKGQIRISSEIGKGTCVTIQLRHRSDGVKHV